MGNNGKVTIKSGAFNFVLEAPDKVWKVTIKSGAFNFVLEAPDKVWKVTIKYKYLQFRTLHLSD